MTRQPSPAPETPSSWVGFKELARRQYERGDYEGALNSYTSALNPDMRCPSSEKQIILSNLVACRLKNGGPAQAQAAVESAKQCIQLNPQWAKGHVRLASAYIALGGHSNDACNELQRALSIDPGNSTAREMLVRELRRDHAHASRANENHHPTEESYDFDESPHPSAYSSSPQHAAMDDSLSWSERIQFHLARVTSWYENQSADVKTIIKIVFIVLVLYVAFGGRFGMEAPRQSGNYGANNAYDQYRRYGTTQTQSQSSHPYTNNNDYGRRGNNHQRRTSSDRDDYYDYNDNYYYNNSPRQSASWHLMDGSVPSMLMLGGIMYAGHRMGINPFQTMMFVNMMQGGRRRMGRGFGMGMGGMGGFGRGRGMGGMGYGRRRF